MMRETSIPSKFFSFLIFGFLLFSITHFNSSNADAATFNVPGDFPTISAAVKDPGVMDGDTINLLAGTFNETNIVINKELTISGAGIGVTIVDAGDGLGIRINADNVRIEDLTVQNARSAIRFAQAFTTFDNADIIRVQFLNNGTGLIVGGTSTVTNLVVRNCQFNNNGKGFRVNKRAHLDGGLIKDSTFDGNTVGIHAFNNNNDSTMRNLKVFDNTFSNHVNGRASAIYLEEAQDTRIQRNMFVDNFNDIVLSKVYQPAVPMSNVLISRNIMMGTTGFVFRIFNADNGGQTVFNGIYFSLNDVMTADATFVLASAHRTGLPSSGGIGWNTVFIRANCVTGTVSAGKGVRYFVPAGLDPNQALGGADLIATKNWWGTANLSEVTDLLQNPTITDVEPIRTSCHL